MPDEIATADDPARPSTVTSCDLSTTCMVCGTEMSAEHAHYRCPACGWRDSCCM